LRSLDRDASQDALLAGRGEATELDVADDAAGAHGRSNRRQDFRNSPFGVDSASALRRRYRLSPATRRLRAGGPAPTDLPAWWCRPASRRPRRSVARTERCSLRETMVTRMGGHTARGATVRPENALCITSCGRMITNESWRIDSARL
jgi:hypothetical protein